MNKIRLMLVDDHVLMRMGLVSATAVEPDMKVVCEIEDGKEAVDAFRTHRPDVVIVDLRLPGMDGIEIIKALRNEFGGVRSWSSAIMGPATTWPAPSRPARPATWSRTCRWKNSWKPSAPSSPENNICSRNCRPSHGAHPVATFRPRTGSAAAHRPGTQQQGNRLPDWNRGGNRQGARHEHFPKVGRGGFAPRRSPSR